MTTTGLTQEYLDQLELMIVNGVTSMTFADQSVEFASFEDLERRIQYVRRALNTGGAGSRLAATSKGV